MQQWQPEQVRKIWQRVQNREERKPEAELHPAVSDWNVCKGIQEIYTEELRDSAFLFRISGRFRGQNAARLRKMAQEDRAHGAMLKGICTMVNGKPPVFGGYLPEKIPLMLMLQRCYGRKMQRIIEYQRRESDPQFGHVFQKLARQEQAHCHILLTIMGNTSRSR